MSNSMSKADAKVFAPRAERDRHEKGSAMELIAADNQAMQAKSARLRALRLERDAEDAAKPAAPAKPAAKRQRKTA